MKKLCKLSIIMPSLNVVDYIDECIQSALNQTLLDKEIICIDAGSTDGTWEKLVAYANNPKYMEEIVLLHCDVRSYGHQVNLGINIAVGEYVAILETDDYVEKNMYEQLYDIGISNDADFVKADYDTFMTFIENKRIFDKVSLFKNGKKQYGKIISPVRELYLYLNDHTIWKGIYKRDFLLNNNILLNETKGAAFQDIGFSLQVLSMAKRGIYIEESFYRYRLDRDESSINSVHGLKYAYWEFSRLLETEEIKRSLVYTDGIFACMALTFCFELVKALRVVGYDINSHFIKPYYTWFNDQLSYSLKNHLLDIDIYLHIPQLRFILENIDKFIFELKENDFVQKTVSLIIEEQQYIASELRSMGILCYPPSANYIFFKEEQGIYERLLKKGILIRSCHNYPGLCHGYFRIAVKSHEQNIMLINAMKEVIKEGSAYGKNNYDTRNNV